MRRPPVMGPQRILCILLIICTARASELFWIGFPPTSQRMSMVWLVLTEWPYMNIRIHAGANIRIGEPISLITIGRRSVISLWPMHCSGWKSSMWMVSEWMRWLQCFIWIMAVRMVSGCRMMKAAERIKKRWNF